MQNQTASNKRRALSPVAYLVLAGAALGLSYVAISRAVDTGSLLEYAAGLVLFGLAAKDVVQAYRQRKTRGSNG